VSTSMWPLEAPNRRLWLWNREIFCCSFSTGDWRRVMCVCVWCVCVCARVRVYVCVCECAWWEARRKP
jgi:hypothetical protein